MVLRLLLRHPLVTHTTIGLIHWHALRLWLRGARFHRHGEATPMTRPIAIRRRPELADPDPARGSPGGSPWPRPARVKVGRLVVVLPDGEHADVRGRPAAEPAAEIHIHDRDALVKLLVGGETGGGEAYMDGLWSSPDLAGLLRWAALNRESLALSAGWFRRPAQLRRTLAHRLAAQHAGARAGGTSRPTTTSATSSTGRSSTRR